MKKVLNISFFYFILAMIMGVFYREFTKFTGFVGNTSLAYIHGHLMVLGTILYLVIALFAKQTNLLKEKYFNTFIVLNNSSLLLLTIMFLIRGIFQVRDISLTLIADKAISGIAGISHICLALSIGILLYMIRNVMLNNEKEQNKSIN